MSFARRLTRRSVMTGTFAFGALAVLAACGQPATPTPAPVAPPKAAEPPKPVAAATKPVDVVKPAEAPKPAEVAKPVEAAKPTEAAKPAVPAAVSKPAAGGGKLIWDTFRATPEYGEDRIKAFQEANPGWTVELRPIPLPGNVQAEAYPKMYAMYAGGTIGDVYAFDPSHWEFYRAVPKGLLRPIDDFVKDDKYDVGQFYAPFIDMQRWQGKLWGLPSWGWSGQDGFVYNQVQFQEAGIKDPDHNSPEWTLDAVREIAKKLTKMGAGGTYDRFGMNLALGAAGATVYSRAFDNPDFYEPKKANITDPNVMKAFKWVQDMAQGDKTIALPGGFQGGAVDLMGSGKLGILQGGSLNVFNVQKAIKDEKVAVVRAALFPKRKDGKRPSQLRGGTWNIGSKSKNPEGAWKFLQTLSSKDGIMKFNTISGQGALVRPDIMDDKYFSHPGFRPFLENLLTAMPVVVPENGRGTEFEQTINQTWAETFLGKIDFENGMKKLQESVNKVLEKPSE